MAKKTDSLTSHYFSSVRKSAGNTPSQAFIFWTASSTRLVIIGRIKGICDKATHAAISLLTLRRKLGSTTWQHLRKAIQQQPLAHPLTLSFEAQWHNSDAEPLNIHLVKHPENALFQLSGYVQTTQPNQEPVLQQAISNLLEKAPVVLNLMDHSGKVIYLTGGGLNLLKMQKNETVGQSIFEQYPPITPYVKRAMQGEQVRFKEEIRQNDNTHYFLSYFLPLQELKLIAGLSFDVSNQEKESEDTAFHRIQSVNKELKERNQLLDTVVYATAHDLKTPIANLEVLMNLYESASTPQERDSYWQALRQSAQRLKGTSQGLMEVISFENTEFNADRISIPELTRSLLEEHRSQLEKLNASVSLKFEVRQIRYNKAYLESILRNLISNSIKYHHQERILEIRIKTEAVKEGVLLEATDNGIGIDLEAHKSRIFKPFKRFSHQAEGSGVGLYLLKRIIERNGGNIQIDSVLNDGCCVRCTLVPYA